MRLPTGTELAIALAAFLLAWYAAGIHVNRRRAGQLVRQVRDSIQPLGGTATIRWIGRSAFRIEVEGLPSPILRLVVNGLLEPRETFLLWLVGRMGGRRDWLMVNATLPGPVGPGFEIYHPRRRGAADSAHRAGEAGWTIEPVPGRQGLVAATLDANARAFALDLLAGLRSVEIWSLSLHPEDARLTISLPVRASENVSKLPVFDVLPSLAEAVIRRRR